MAQGGENRLQVPPNLEIQPDTRASAQLAADVDRSRIASAQRVDLSTTVKR
jgi:hypothetical protein